MDKPAFEIRDGDKVYKIWAHGSVEGFPPGSVIVNRIDQYAWAQIEKLCDARGLDLTTEPS